MHENDVTDAEPTAKRQQQCRTDPEHKVTLAEHKVTLSEHQVTLAEHKVTLDEHKGTLAEPTATDGENARTSLVFWKLTSFQWRKQLCPGGRRKMTCIVFDRVNFARQTRTSMSFTCLYPAQEKAFSNLPVLA